MDGAALPSYQARLLEGGGASRAGSLSRSDSHRTSLLSKGSLGRADPLSTGNPSDDGSGGGLHRTGSARWATTGRGHTSGSRSVDVTRGFWAEREKAAAAEADLDLNTGGSVELARRRSESLRRTGAGGASVAVDARSSTVTADDVASDAGNTSSVAFTSFSSGSSLATASTLSNGTGPAYSPPPSLVGQQQQQTTRLGGSTPPSSERSASPTQSPSATTSSMTTSRTHRRANSAQPTFVFQPAASAAASSASSIPALRAQLTGDRHNHNHAPQSPTASAPLMERSRTYESLPSPIASASATATTPPPRTLSRASSITSRFNGRTSPASTFSNEPPTPTSASVAFPTSAGSVSTEQPLFSSKYMRDRHARLLSNSSADNSSAAAAAAASTGVSTSSPASPTGRQFNPAPTYHYQPSSSTSSTAGSVPSSPALASFSGGVPAIREPPLGPRRGPAARLGRHMPRIASGDGNGFGDHDEENTPGGSGGSAATPSNVTNGSRRGAGIALGGDGSMGRGVLGIGAGDEVVGMKGRRRLPLASSSLNTSTSLRLSTATIERTRKEIIAEEYLTHVGEALQWVEGVLQKDLGFGVVEFEEKLRDGVILARVAEAVGAKGCERIFENPKLQWRHSDNIILFLQFTQSPEVGLPKNFIFETIDLYEKKNLPKVIFCIHSLSHVLANRGLVEKMGNLKGKLTFTDAQLQAASRDLNGQAMPNFSSIGKDLAKEMNLAPPPETEEEIRDRLLKAAKSSIVALQSQATGAIARSDYRALLHEVRCGSRYAVGLQAHARGVLARRSFQRARAVRSDQIAPVSRTLAGFQTLSRGALVRHRALETRRRLRACDAGIAKFQCQIRGVLARDAFDTLREDIAANIDIFEGFIAHARGALIRRAQRTVTRDLATTHQTITSFAAVARSALARRKVQAIKTTLATISPGLAVFQAQAKANIVRRNHRQLAAALANVQTISSAVGSQTLFRAALSRARKGEQKKEVEFVLPNFVGFQAMARRAYQKTQHEDWVDHLWSHQFVAVHLQRLFRGAAARRVFYGRLAHFHRNMDAIVRLQAIRRGKGPREGWNGIKLGTNVRVSTIKNFGHLLDDSDAQFEEEARLNVLRQDVVETFRATQALESDVEDLDQKIGRFAHNIAAFQSRGRVGDSGAQDALFVDPFSTAMLSREAQHKLDLYQQLFYLLQTRVEYLAKLCSRLPVSVGDPTRKLVESVVLALYGYGQGKREEYWAMAFFQSAVRFQFAAAPDFESLQNHYYPFAKIAIQYVRPKEVQYVQDLLGPLVGRIVADLNLNLDTDAVKIYHAFKGERDARAGVHATASAAQVSHFEAIEDPETRAEYIHRLQATHHHAKELVRAITTSTGRIPYLIRWIAREILLSLRHRYPEITDEQAAPIIGSFVFQRFLKPAILVPETFGIVSATISHQTRANLKEIADLVEQVSSGQEFEPSHRLHALNAYIQQEGKTFRKWLVEVADVVDVKEHLGIDEYIDVAVEPLPLSISPSEIYAIHRIIAQDIDEIEPEGNVLRSLLTELIGPPLASEITQKDRPISLKLMNRSEPMKDPDAESKAEWAMAKRLILAVLRVQPGKDIMSSLIAPVEEEHMILWEQMVQDDSRSLPPLPGQQQTIYSLQDIKSLPYDDVKVQALLACQRLQTRGVVSQADGYQTILNSIANDIRTKNRKQIQRQKDIKSMQNALAHLEEKKAALEEQIELWNVHNAQSISNMQKKSKRTSVIPLTKQYWHRRSLQQEGLMPEYGSWIYDAAKLSSRGLLLSIDQHPPTQYDRIKIVLSSEAAGLFNIEISFAAPGLERAVVDKSTANMQDLLERQRDRKESVKLGLATFNTTKLVDQLNRKFYKN